MGAGTDLPNHRKRNVLRHHCRRGLNRRFRGDRVGRGEGKKESGAQLKEENQWSGKRCLIAITPSLLSRKKQQFRIGIIFKGGGKKTRWTPWARGRVYRDLIFNYEKKHMRTGWVLRGSETRILFHGGKYANL